MMSDPLTRSSSTGHMYEYGEYDGLVDLDAILHGAVGNNPPAAAASPTPAISNNGGSPPGPGTVPLTSPTPNLSVLAGSDSRNEYPISTGNTNHHNNNNNYASGDRAGATSLSSPRGGRKPTRDSSAGRQNVLSPDRYPGVHGSNNSVPRSNGGYPMMMEDSETTLTGAATTTNATPAAAVGPRGGPHKRGESAKANRNNNNNNNNSSHANGHYPNTSPSKTNTYGNATGAGSTTTNNNNNTAADGNVHLPVIMPSQQRRPTETLMQPRVRVSPLTQDTTAAVTGSTSNMNNNNNNNSGSNNAVSSTPHNPRTATSVSPLVQHNTPRTGGAKTVMSASNLAALHRNSHERASTGPMSTGTSTNKVPPYLAPPLSPLHTRQNPAHAAVTGAITGPSASTNANSATGATPLLSRPTGDTAMAATTPHGTLVDHTSPASRSNGWVKEEARRIERTSQELAAGFPPEKLRQSSTHSNSGGSGQAAHNAAAAASSENVRGSAEVHTGGAAAAAAAAAVGGSNGNAGRGKVNTSPAPTAPRAPVWSNDYELGRSDLIGCTAPADFGAMPKVAAPPLPQRAKKTLSDSASRRPAPFRPPPHIPSTPPVGKTSSPVESVLSPLRAAAHQPHQQQNQQQQQHPPPPPPPLAHPNLTPANQTSAAATTPLGSGASNPVKSAAAAAAPAAPQADLTDSKTHSGSSHPPPVHVLSASHRRVMNAVDTHDAAVLDRKAAVAVVAVPAGGTTYSAATRPKMPYSEDRRAALEAWAAFPALDVTMRGQAPTAVQVRRERDFAAARPLVVQQLYQPVKGQAPQEFAGEPFEMNYDVHNVVVQLRHRNRPLQMAYPARLPLEPDMRPRLRRQRTPRSFYGKRFPHQGDAWFRNALDDARHIDSPDIESMEKREEEEFIRNGGDPAQRRNRYGQANNHNNNNQQQQQQQQQRAAPHAGTGAPNIDQMNRNAVRMEQPAA